MKNQNAIQSQPASTSETRPRIRPIRAYVCTGVPELAPGFASIESAVVMTDVTHGVR